jgi:HPt (histidine-containing phosphotransfer) domain-containing protein
MKECCRQFLNDQFGGDEDVVNEIYAEYVSSINQKTEEALLAFVKADWDTLDSVAHAVKGNALATGDTELADTAIALRSAAKLHDEAESRRLVGRIKELRATL